MSRKKKSGGKEKERDEEMSATFRNIENARSSGRSEGVEACLRIIDALEPTATRDDVAKAIRVEMKRRTWIE